MAPSIDTMIVKGATPTPKPVPKPTPEQASASAASEKATACIPAGQCVPASGDVLAEGAPVSRIGDKLDIPGDDYCNLETCCADVLANGKGIGRKIDFGIGCLEGKTIGPRDIAPSVLLPPMVPPVASATDEYSRTISLLEEAWRASEGNENRNSAAHDYIQNKRRDPSQPAAVRDSPEIVNAHRFWKGLALRQQLGWLPAVGAAEFDFWMKFLGIDDWLYRDKPWYGGFGTELAPSPFRPAATKWFMAGIYAKPPPDWPTRRDVDPQPLLLDAEKLRRHLHNIPDA